MGQGEYTIKIKTRLRILFRSDYYGLDVDKDLRAVTRPPTGNDAQKWLLTPVGRDEYTIQQKSTLRYLDAYDTPDSDYGVVTREKQDSNTQVWVIKSEGPRPDTPTPSPTPSPSPTWIKVMHHGAKNYKAKFYVSIVEQGQPKLLWASGEKDAVYEQTVDLPPGLRTVHLNI